MKFDIDKLYTTVNQTYITNPKDLYFIDADNNNIPNLITHCETGKGEPGGHGPGPQFLNSQGDLLLHKYVVVTHCTGSNLSRTVVLTGVPLI